LLQFDNGATGVLTATQVAAGEENNLSIKIYGEEGGLEWHQQEPNTLLLKWLNKPTEVYRAGMGFNSDIAKSNSRTPGGHPEGYLEAFGNIYRNFARTLQAKIGGQQVDTELVEFPSVKEGIRGMAFIDNVVRSHESNEKWTTFEV
jgi:predicted dehydrogenase